MTTAVVTFSYNESFNLPIWIEYYGRNFGNKNLFVVDRSSTDGSTSKLGDVNILTIPRKEFDEFEKTSLVTSLQHSLLNAFDTVIITDCDEILVPDPAEYQSLSEYLARNDFEHMNAIGLEIHHLIDREPPLDLSRPMLTQRSIAKFQSPSCKKLITRVPLQYLNGFHSCDKAPCFDQKLFMFHTKVVDYAASFLRQGVNIDTTWSRRSSEAIPNTHHKYDLKKFVHQNFLVPLDLINRGELQEFDFLSAAGEFTSRTELANGFYYIPMDMRFLVPIPERFANCI